MSLLVVLAGCSLAGPGPAPTPTPSEGDPAQFNVTNFESSPATAEIYVANGPIESLELQYANGTTQTVAPPYIGEQGELRSAILALEDVPAVTTPGAEVQELLEVPPGESVTSELSVRQGATVIMVARVDGTVVAVGIMQCGTTEQMNQVAFVVGGYGPLIGGGCQGV